MSGCRGQRRASGTTCLTLAAWLLASWTHSAQWLLEWPPMRLLAQSGVASLHSGRRGPAGKQLSPDGNVMCFLMVRSIPFLLAAPGTKCRCIC